MAKHITTRAKRQVLGLRATAEASGLAQRIVWILESRRLSRRELCRRSGLDPLYLGNFLHRAKQTPSASMATDTLEALARGGGVSIAWLATGEGSPDEPAATAGRKGISVFIDGRLMSLSPERRRMLRKEAESESVTPTPVQRALRLLDGFVGAGYQVPEDGIEPLVAAVLESPEIEIARRIRAGRGTRGDLALALAQRVIARALRERDALAISRPPTATR